MQQAGTEEFGTLDISNSTFTILALIHDKKIFIKVCLEV